MAFLKQKDPEFDGVCDNCGKKLEDADDPVPDDGNGHEFCSAECEEEYAESHEHEEDGEEDICEFC